MCTSRSFQRSPHSEWLCTIIRILFDRNEIWKRGTRPRLPACVTEFAGSLSEQFVLRIRSLRAGTEFRIWNGGVGSLDKTVRGRVQISPLAEQDGSERTSMSEGSGGSPLKSEMGNTTISNTVVTQIAGIAAQEVENAQMSGGASAAVGGILQSVTGSATGGGNFSRGVSVEVGEEEAAVDLTMTVDYGQSIPRITEAARRNVINRVENLTGLRVTEVNILVNDVQIPEQQPVLEQ